MRASRRAYVAHALVRRFWFSALLTSAITSSPCRQLIGQGKVLTCRRRHCSFSAYMVSH